jgi:hypothetical protein
MALAGAAPVGAGAATYDIQLRLLGPVNPLPQGCGSGVACTVAADGQAQFRFARLGSALGLAFAPAWNEPAGTTGQAGFETSLSVNGAFVGLTKAEWATEGGKEPPPVLPVTSLHLRKGLGGSIDLGFRVSYLPGSQMVGMGAELRAGLLDGLESAPDVAVRVWGEHLLGAGELFVNEVGADLLVSRSFGLGGLLQLQPFLQIGVAFLQLDAAWVDFSPQDFKSADPFGNHDIFQSVKLFDNSYLRSALGLRLVTGAVILGIEGGGAWGSNVVSSSAAAGKPAASQSTNQYSASFHLGLGF